MFVRITQIIVVSEQWDVFLNTFETQTIPQLEGQAGFMRIICSGDPATGVASLITMWQNQTKAAELQD